MFTGLSAFPLSPFKDDKVNLHAYERILDRLVSAKVQSICTMGSTGLYPYLSLSEKQLLVKKTVELSDGIPVMAGVGSLRTAGVLHNIEAVQEAGADAVLLAPMSYHPLSNSEVLSLYETASQHLSVPMCVYENPRTTQFSFTDDLYYEVSRLKNIAAIKIPGTCFNDASGETRLAKLRSIVPENVAIGVSGDKFGTSGMASGCDVWFSVIGGLFPRTVLELISISKSAANQNIASASAKYDDIWNMFAKHNGGLRVMASAAEILGYANDECLPKPLMSLNEDDKLELKKVLLNLGLN